MVIHVAAAIIAGGVFTVGAAATGLYLLRRRADARDAGGQATRGYAGRLPAGATLERVAHTAHLVAFPVWTFAVLAGAIWAEESWGRYWGWDPKETWSLISIIVYTLVTHSRMIPGMKDTYTFNLISLFAFSSVLMTYFGVNYYLSGLHSYAGGDPVPVPVFVYVSVAVLVGLAVSAGYRYRRA